VLLSYGGTAHKEYFNALVLENLFIDVVQISHKVVSLAVDEATQGYT
jgi:hypothetical protein